MTSHRQTASDSQSSILAEQQRLDEDAKRQRHWKRWGPYLSERAWGTVREDYSPDGRPGKRFPMIMPDPAPIAGTRTASPASAIAIN